MGVDQDFINLAVFLIGSADAVTGIRRETLSSNITLQYAVQYVVNRVTSNRHVGTGEVVSLCQRVSHEGRLRTTGTVTETEDDDWQIVITYETGNTVVNYSHGEQCRSTFFGLHTAG